MGNVLAQPARLQPEPLSDLPNVVLKDQLGEAGGLCRWSLWVVERTGLRSARLAAGTAPTQQ